MKLGQNHHPIKNKNKIAGIIKGVGFRAGSEKDKSAGVYAFKKGCAPEQLQEDTINHENLSSYNNFILNCIAEFTQVAPASNSRLMLDASLPSWHESQWPLAAIEDKQIVPNVIITHNGFHNEIHVDQHDVNPWTYGLFSFINADTFECL
ncbi:hypothetical protein O181_036225 [Austropuccinia psidii MF-1]|uniref:Tet-like 2OG-Fe(II) oxygenase domain-containing protein n=1 Tax=Austropuccinia psidii MF-1 TaxID=1389203 RepID=A0A9Q3HBZ2_9BASI|nr:hypothetical protein [Austropuccinia psidii MF-1]